VKGYVKGNADHSFCFSPWLMIIVPLEISGKNHPAGVAQTGRMQCAPTDKKHPAV
jgi:hypothetical protein